MRGAAERTAGTRSQHGHKVEQLERRGRPRDAAAQHGGGFRAESSQRARHEWPRSATGGMPSTYVRCHEVEARARLHCACSGPKKRRWSGAGRTSASASAIFFVNLVSASCREGVQRARPCARRSWPARCSWWQTRPAGHWSRRMLSGCASWPFCRMSSSAWPFAVHTAPHLLATCRRSHRPPLPATARHLLPVYAPGRWSAGRHPICGQRAPGAHCRMPQSRVCRPRRESDQPRQRAHCAAAHRAASHQTRDHVEDCVGDGHCGSRRPSVLVLRRRSGADVRLCGRSAQARPAAGHVSCVPSSDRPVVRSSAGAGAGRAVRRDRAAALSGSAAQMRTVATFGGSALHSQKTS